MVKIQTATSRRKTGEPVSNIWSADGDHLHCNHLPALFKKYYPAVANDIQHSPALKFMAACQAQAELFAVSSARKVHLKPWFGAARLHSVDTPIRNQCL